jgi:hypothetical protein
MNKKSVIYVILAMIIGVLFGTTLGPAILESPSAFSLGVLIGAVYGPVIGNTPSAYSLVAMSVALSGVIIGWLIATTVREKNV